MSKARKAMKKLQLLNDGGALLIPQIQPPQTTSTKPIMVWDNNLQRLVPSDTSNAATSLEKWWKQKANCKHDAKTPVFNIGPTALHGGEKWQVHDDDTAVLRVDCSDSSNIEEWNFPPGFEQLAKFKDVAVPTIQIPWGDHQIPPVHFGFWPALVQLLPAGKVIVFCMGGHGRTGTALAALAIVGLDLPAIKAMELIHEKHCKEAIETASQRTYLHRLAAWWQDNRMTFDVEGV